MLNIGPTLKFCRESRHLTLQQLATLTGLAKSYLSRVENSQRDPTINSLDKISDALHIPLNIIILLAETKTESSSSIYDEFNNIMKKNIMDELSNGKKLEIQK